MVSANTLCKKLLNVKNCVIEGLKIIEDADSIDHIRIAARPSRWHEDDCPICHRRCPRYDSKCKTPRLWRGLDWEGHIVEVEYKPHRIVCPDHGVLVADVPWAYPGSRFTKNFDLTVGWLAMSLSRSAVAEYMRIDWETVGRCVHRTLKDIEPNRARRLDGLKRIGIDETSYKKGHKYITVIVNHDTNTVVWAAPGHGKSVLEAFYSQLPEEQLASIEVVTGDGARWITDCVNEFTPDCERCVDPFHVVEWAMEALDEVRREVWKEAHDEMKRLATETPVKRGRPRKDDSAAAALREAKERVEEIKGAAYTLGKAPEHLTEKQRAQLEMIAQTNPKLHRAYLMKEKLRLLLKLKDVNEAASELKRWLWWASHSRIPAFKKLYEKIKRHMEHILNTIRLGVSNARVEATNNKIKLIVRKAYGFRNIENMLDMVYLVCSDLRIPLPNRNLTAA